MAKALQYLKYARKMNEYFKSGYFGIDWQLHIFLEMVSIFFRFWWNDIYLFYLYVNDLD